MLHNNPISIKPKKVKSNVKNNLTLQISSKAFIYEITVLKAFIALSLMSKLLKNGSDKIPFTIQYTSNYITPHKNHLNHHEY